VNQPSLSTALTTSLPTIAFTMSTQGQPSPNHLKTKSLSVARSPSHLTSATVPGPSDLETNPYFIDHTKSKRSSTESDKGDDSYDEARALVEEMEIVDGPAHEGFDRPDRREMTLILGSTAMVVLVAVAAGLTTIYDWIL
jgi:hypothetical protein